MSCLKSINYRNFASFSQERFSPVRNFGYNELSLNELYIFVITVKIQFFSVYIVIKIRFRATVLALFAQVTLYLQFFIVIY